MQMGNSNFGQNMANVEPTASAYGPDDRQRVDPTTALTLPGIYYQGFKQTTEQAVVQYSFRFTYPTSDFSSRYIVSLAFWGVGSQWVIQASTQMGNNIAIGDRNESTIVDAEEPFFYDVIPLTDPSPKLSLKLRVTKNGREPWSLLGSWQYAAPFPGTVCFREILSPGNHAVLDY